MNPLAPVGSILRFAANTHRRVPRGMHVEEIPESGVVPDEDETRFRPRAKRGAGKVETPMETYLREINELPLLTADEEKALARRRNAGDPDAENELTRHNLRLVVNIARGYQGRGLSLQDLIEEGNMGLMKASKKFSPTAGTRFSTYATYWIKQAIRRSLSQDTKTVRIPAYMVDIISKVKAKVREMSTQQQREVSVDEAMQALKLPKKKIPIIKRAIKAQATGAAGESAGDESKMGIDDQPSHRTLAPDEEAIRNEEQGGVLDNLFRVLRKREMEVISMRFPRDGTAPKTLKEVGEALGITRERVRQIEAEALDRLRNTALTGSPVPRPAIQPQTVIQTPPTTLGPPVSPPPIVANRVAPVLPASVNGSGQKPGSATAHTAAPTATANGHAGQKRLLNGAASSPAPHVPETGNGSKKTARVKQAVDEPQKTRGKATARRHEAPEALPVPKLPRRYAGLNDNEKRVIAARDGLADQPKLSLRALGKRLRMSKERVRQIEARARQKLSKA